MSSQYPRNMGYVMTDPRKGEVRQRFGEILERLQIWVGPLGGSELQKPS
jgi:hypothetical protein